MDGHLPQHLICKFHLYFELAVFDVLFFFLIRLQMLDLAGKILQDWLRLSLLVLRSSVDKPLYVTFVAFKHKLFIQLI